MSHFLPKYVDIEAFVGLRTFVAGDMFYSLLPDT